MHWRIVVGASLSVLGLTVSAAGQTEGAAPAEDPNAAPVEAAPPDAAGAPPAEGEAPAPDAEPGVPAEAGAEAAPDAGPPLGPPPGAEGEEDYEEPELPMTPPAPDGLGGHFLLGAAAGYQKSLGKFGSEMRQSSQVDGGLSVTVDAGFGVGRQVALGAWGQWFLLPDGS